MKVIELQNKQLKRYFSTVAKAASFLKRPNSSVKYALDWKGSIDGFKIRNVEDATINITMVDVF